MPKFFKKTPKKGMPISLIGLADCLAAIEKALKTLSCRGGDVSWNFGRPEIVPYGSDGSTTAVPDGSTAYDILVWDTTDEEWKVKTMTQLSFITSFQYDTSTHKWQYKKTTGYVYDAGTEDAAWTDITTAIEGVSV